MINAPNGSFIGNQVSAHRQNTDSLLREIRENLRVCTEDNGVFQGGAYGIVTVPPPNLPQGGGATPMSKVTLKSLHIAVSLSSARSIDALERPLDPAGGFRGGYTGLPCILRSNTFQPPTEVFHSTGNLSETNKLSPYHLRNVRISGQAHHRIAGTTKTTRSKILWQRSTQNTTVRNCIGTSRYVIQRLREILLANKLARELPVWTLQVLVSEARVSNLDFIGPYIYLRNLKRLPSFLGLDKGIDS